LRRHLLASLRGGADNQTQNHPAPFWAIAGRSRLFWHEGDSREIQGRPNYTHNGKFLPGEPCAEQTEQAKVSEAVGVGIGDERGSAMGSGAIEF
jgi:hypothetical protein